MTEAEARGLLDQFVPPEQRFPEIATAEEVARIRRWMAPAPEAWEPGAVEALYGASANAMASIAAFCGASGLPIGMFISDVLLPFWFQVERAVTATTPTSAEELEAIREVKLGLQAEMHAIAAAWRSRIAEARS